MCAITLTEVLHLIRSSAPANSACCVGSLSVYSDALTVGSHPCERMEFLGDAILCVTVTQYLYDRFPSSREGFLTNMRSKIVSAKMLCDIGSRLALQVHARGRKDEAIAVDDILEALIAAISIDQGTDAAKTWFINVLEHHVDLSALVSHHESSKQHLTLLSGALTFTKIESPKGMISVCLTDAYGVVLGTATATNRKDAEEESARKALATRLQVHLHVDMPRPAMARRLITACHE